MFEETGKGYCLWIGGNGLSDQRLQSVTDAALTTGLPLDAR